MVDATRELLIILRAKNEAKAILSAASGDLDDLNKKANPVIDSFKTLGVMAASGAVAITAFGIKAGFSAARIEELTFALHAIAKANNLSTEAADNTVATLRKYNIAYEKSLQITSLFMQSQLDLADAIKLANVAKDLAVISGQDSSEATRTLTEAIASQSVLMLRQFGIVTTLNTLYEKHAEVLGKSVDELTETEKKQAFLNEILQSGTKVTGTYDAAMESVSKRFRSLTGRVIPDFIATIGLAFSPSIGVIVDDISQKIQDLTNWLQTNDETVKQWGINISGTVRTIVNDITALVVFLSQNKEVILAVLIAMGIGLVMLGGAFIAAHAVAVAAITGIILVVTLLLKVWNSNFLGIRTITEAVMKWFNDVGVPIFQRNFESLKSFVTGALTVWIDNFTKARNAVQSLINILDSLISKSKQAFSNSMGGFKFPFFQHGGFVPGAYNQAVPAILHGGERVVPRNGVDVGGGMGSGVNLTITFTGPVSMDSEGRIEELAQKILGIMGRQNELATYGMSV